MAGIREVAELAGVSKSTVSIVINGKSEERKIPPATQEKVIKAMKELNYQINLSAKKMRTPDTRKTVALFWTTDFREVMLARFLNGLQIQIKESALPYDIIIHPYENNHLDQEASLKNISTFHGALIANAGEQDMEYLHTLSPLVPFVLYNRISDRFSSVYVDDTVIAQNAFRLLKDKGAVGIVKAPYAFEGMRIRDSILSRLLNENRQPYLEYEISGNSAEEGFKLAHSLDFQNLDVIYAASDMIALGIMYYCHEHGIRIPQDIKILAIGNGLTNFDQYLSPSLSVIQIPMEAMAARCILMLDRQFQHSELERQAVEPEIILRSSFYC